MISKVWKYRTQQLWIRKQTTNRGESNQEVANKQNNMYYFVSKQIPFYTSLSSSLFWTWKGSSLSMLKLHSRKGAGALTSWPFPFRFFPTLFHRHILTSLYCVVEAPKLKQYSSSSSSTHYCKGQKARQITWIEKQANQRQTTWYPPSLKRSRRCYQVLCKSWHVERGIERESLSTHITILGFNLFDRENCLSYDTLFKNRSCGHINNLTYLWQSPDSNAVLMLQTLDLQLGS